MTDPASADIRQVNTSGAALHVPAFGQEIGPGDEIKFGSLLPGFTAVGQGDAAADGTELDVSDKPQRRSKTTNSDSTTDSTATPTDPAEPPMADANPEES